MPHARTTVGDTADGSQPESYTIEEERDDTSVRYALRLAEGDRICICMNITVTGSHPQLGGSAIVGLRFRNSEMRSFCVETDQKAPLNIRHANAGGSADGTLQQYYEGMTAYDSNCCKQFEDAESYSNLVSRTFHDLVLDNKAPDEFVKYWRGLPLAA